MKLITIDLVGTLLNRKNAISQKIIRAIKNAQEQVTEIAIATGRAHFNVQFLLKEAGIFAWIPGVNGATVHDKVGNLLRETSINKNQAKEILEYFEEHDYFIATLRKLNKASYVK
ncbi:HAD family hydrolase [Peribacillus simplex]|uniref:HAD family hydrolase n=1 Tax=Peribacillus simplex TaxID=1478 RepID=UPI0038259499